MSELRKDLVSSDWILLAPERAGRGDDFGKLRKKRKPSPLKGCPFENLKATGNWPPVFIYPDEKKWQVVIFPNKHPALSHKNECSQEFKKGPFILRSGVGRHDLLVTRNHLLNFSHLPKHEEFLILKILQKYFLYVKKDPCLVYTSFFHNWGPTSGATVYHPHYQIITLPIIPPDVESSLRGSERYFKAHHKCVHCEMIRYEKKDKKRIIFENDNAIVFAPFVSREPFELRVFPKKHISAFEETSPIILKDVAEALRDALSKVERKLADPDYNFFLHTAPFKSKEKYLHYHWHIEILPKISFLGGFELGTGIEINVIDPVKATQLLNKK